MVMKRTQLAVLVCFILLSILLLSACGPIGQAGFAFDNTNVIPEGYAAPWDSAGSMLLKGEVSVSGDNYIVNVSMDQPNGVIYKKLYITKTSPTGNVEWVSKDFSGDIIMENGAQTSWMQSSVNSAIATLVLPKADYTETEFYFVAYSCEDLGNEQWDCADNKWKINYVVLKETSTFLPGDPYFDASDLESAAEDAVGFGDETVICGNGIVNGESCDDGNLIPGDGCDHYCAVESGWACTETNPSQCALICGNGHRDFGEHCDDGNLLNDDGCSDACTGEFGWQCTLDNPSKCTYYCTDENIGDEFYYESCPGIALPPLSQGPDTPVLSKIAVYKRDREDVYLSPSASLDFAFDAADNLIVTGASSMIGQRIYDANPNGASLWVKKYSANLDLFNEKYLINYGKEAARSDGAFNHQGQSVAVDNSGNSFVAGYIYGNYNPTYQTIIAKFSPTLNLIRKNVFSYGQYGAIGSDMNSNAGTVTVAVDSKGNAFLAGLDSLGRGAQLLWLDKFDNNLEKIKGVNLSYLPEFTLNSGTMGGQVVIDEDDNVYFISLVTMESLGPIPSLAAAKYDSNLNLIKVISQKVSDEPFNLSAPLTTQMRGVAIDDTNIYVVISNGDIIVLSKDLQFKKRIPFTTAVYNACGLNLPPGIALGKVPLKDIASDNNGHLYVLHSIPLNLINVNLNPGENAYNAAGSCIQTYTTSDFSLLSTVKMDFKEIPLDSETYQELKTKSPGFKLEYAFAGKRLDVDSQGNLFVIGDTYLVFPRSTSFTSIGQFGYQIPHYHEVELQTFVAKFTGESTGDVVYSLVSGDAVSDGTTVVPSCTDECSPSETKCQTHSGGYWAKNCVKVSNCYKWVNTLCKHDDYLCQTLSCNVVSGVAACSAVPADGVACNLGSGQVGVCANSQCRKGLAGESCVVPSACASSVCTSGKCA